MMVISSSLRLLFARSTMPICACTMPIIAHNSHQCAYSSPAPQCSSATSSAAYQHHPYQHRPCQSLTAFYLLSTLCTTVCVLRALSVHCVHYRLCTVCATVCALHAPDPVCAYTVYIHGLLGALSTICCMSTGHTLSTVCTVYHLLSALLSSINATPVSPTVRGQLVNSLPVHASYAIPLYIECICFRSIDRLLCAICITSIVYCLLFTSASSRLLQSTSAAYL